MVSRGKFVLHSRAVPPLTAGDYVLKGTQTITTGAGRPTAPYDANIRVTSPRYKLPPDQILSTFPPANSEGAYESRLPQIVLKRRTLPWERASDPADRKVPWLALVVIAEGEGEISPEVSVGECVTPGVVLAGPNDVAASIYLSVPRTTVNKVFPTKQDLQLLAHVRQVDLEDTELAMGDDDGYLAVVMANRLPQFDRVACKPVRYAACLINLEGQLDALPPPTPPKPDFLAVDKVFNVMEFYVQSGPGDGSPDKIAMASQAKVQPAMNAQHLEVVDTGGFATTPLKIASSRHAKTATPRPGAAGDWQAITKAVEKTALGSGGSDVAYAVRDTMKAGFRLPIEGVVVEKVYRFPVLAHWSFTCDGAGSFESLMRGIDVGLLGTLPGPGAKKAVPECAAPAKGTAPPDAPSPRPEPEVAETGHVGLAHKTRAGDGVRAWYRGPFVPMPTEREIAMTPQGPALAHASDQLRSVVPDGREDLSLAVAFEIGRLLALSRPAFVNALMAWRREQFGAERARRLARLAAKSIGDLGHVLKNGVIASLGPDIGRAFVLEAAVKPRDIFGPFRPAVDPGRPIEFLDDHAADILALGLSVDASVIEQMRSTGSISVLDRASVPMGKAAGGAERFGHLTDGLAAEVQRVAADAMPSARTGVASRRAAPSVERDVLDGIIDELAAERRGENR